MTSIFYEKGFVMGKTKIRKITWYRNGFYYLYEDGKIQKPDGYISDGISWRWLGLCKKLPFGRLEPIIFRKDCFDITDLKYTNGKYRYAVIDFDHGTKRIWSQ